MADRWVKVLRTAPGLAARVTSVLRRHGIHAHLGDSLYRPDERARAWVRTDSRSVYVPPEEEREALRLIARLLSRLDESMARPLAAVREGMGLLVACSAIAILFGALLRESWPLSLACLAALCASFPLALRYVRRQRAKRKAHRQARSRWPGRRS
jgi:hypothetical protein